MWVCCAACGDMNRENSQRVTRSSKKPLKGCLCASIRSELVTILSQCLAFSIKITMVFFTHLKNFTTTISDFFIQGHQKVRSKASYFEICMSMKARKYE